MKHTVIYEHIHPGGDTWERQPTRTIHTDTAQMVPRVGEAIGFDADSAPYDVRDVIHIVDIEAVPPQHTVYVRYR